MSPASRRHFIPSKIELTDSYSALPPADWDCESFHPDADPEEVQPGDENFHVIIDEAGWLVVFDGHSYHATVALGRGTQATAAEAMRKLGREGLRITHITHSPTQSHLYVLKMRELTEHEKDFFHDIDQL